MRITQRVEEDGEQKTKALSEDKLRALLAEIPDEWQLFFSFLAHTGLRIGEAIALRWSDVDFARRRVRVERRFYRSRYAPPKSKYGRRCVPISKGMARRLSALWNETRAGEDELVFTSSEGLMVDQSNLMSRVLKPAARRAGLGAWPGFHTLRHTAASMMFRHGWNAKQVQVTLGHHSPAFTLATYVVHLLPDDLPDPGFLDELTAEPAAEVATDVATRQAATSRDGLAAVEAI